MMHTIMAVVAGLLVQFGVQRAAATTLNFDGFAGGALVTMPISGVTFTLANASAPSIFNIGPTGGTASSPPNTLLNASSFAVTTPSSILTIAFSTPVNDVSLAYTYENGDVTFTVFQGTTTTVITEPFDSVPLSVDFADFSAFSGVTAITVSSSYPDDYIAIDDLNFVPVPEPAMAALGLVGLIAVRRRRYLDFD
jgi:hypothetical protein